MNVAFIPVRGGSKSIPLKNIKKINGKPLVFWTIRAACLCKSIDKVFVSTDSEVISTTVTAFKTGNDEDLFSKVVVISRSKESATDTASTEFAMLEFASQYEFDNIVLIQATSPLLQSTDLDNGFIAYSELGVDSVLSVVPQKRFHWSIDEKGYAFPTNYDVYHRPRRQEFSEYYVENGAFYICSREDLIKSKNRVSGNIKVVKMNEDSFFEIDEPSDWTIIEALMRKNNISYFDVPEIKLLLTDCDGCLTDGGMYYSEFGDELKKFNTRDGMGFSLLHKEGIKTGLVTSENVKLNKRRADKLKLDYAEFGCTNKLKRVIEICDSEHIEMKNVCYIGDDINDIDLLRAVGFSCCPSDATEDVKGVVDYIATARGGAGVLREITDIILKRNPKK